MVSEIFGYILVHHVLLTFILFDISNLLWTFPLEIIIHHLMPEVKYMFLKPNLPNLAKPNLFNGVWCLDRVP